MPKPSKSTKTEVSETTTAAVAAPVQSSAPASAPAPSLFGTSVTISVTPMIMFRTKSWSMKSGSF